MSDPVTVLTEAGVSIWLDDLSRERLVGGDLARLVRDRHVVGVTTNPTIFARAISGSDAYAEQIQQLALRGVGTDEALRELTAFDVRWAADVLRPVFEATNGVDGRVSIEVDPRIAGDTDRTIAEARSLWWLVDRPNLFIKIPAAEQGLPAISACLAEGISINVTLIFSVARYAEVVEAFLVGLERARDRGLDLSEIASVASLFVSRVDTEVDQRLDEVGNERATELRGRAAIANARLAYRQYERTLATDRWRALERAGARPQRPLWASTGVKDPACRDTRYVEGLVAPGVVMTMPEATLDAVADHGHVPVDSIHGTCGAAEQVLADLADLGVDYDDVMRVLETEGIEKFDASWDALGHELLPVLTAPRTDRGSGMSRWADDTPEPGGPGAVAAGPVVRVGLSRRSSSGRRTPR
jgi:transaldolase